MNESNLHSAVLDPEKDGFFSKGKIVWEKSNALVWEELEEKLGKAPARVVPLRNRFYFKAAATVLLLLALGSGSMFWTKTIVCPQGKHMVADLPDGSTVELNAGSSLKYSPLKWKFARHLTFQGEGFFNVEKGKKFEVVSELGTTTVLGTSFNIYSRDELYKVSCVSGKVQVTDKNLESVTLLPRQQAVIKMGEALKKENFVKTDYETLWRKNQFYFTGAPIRDVIREVELQYNVKINLYYDLDGSVTCNFDRQTDVETVLGLICKPLDFKFSKNGENTYGIVANK